MDAADDKNLYLTVFESIPDPAVLLKDDDTIMLMNYPAAKLMEHEKPPGAYSCSGLFKGANIPWLEEELRTFRAGEDAETQFEKKYSFGNNAVYLHVCMKKMEDVGGKFLGTLVVLQDITERKKMDDLLCWDVQVNSALEELAALILRSASINEISRLVLDYVKRFTCSPLGCVGYIDHEAGRLVSPVLSTEAMDSCDFPGEKDVSLKAGGLWGWVLEHRKPLLTNNPAEDPRAVGSPECRLPVRRFLAVPSLIGDRIVGLIVLANADNEYGDTELAVTERFASLYALAINHMRSEESLRRKNEELEKAYADLKSAQSRMLQQEKMASIGQLAAGVAHEINNPMGFIISNLGSLSKYMQKLLEYTGSQAGTIEELSSRAGNETIRTTAIKKLDERKRMLKIDYVTGDISGLIRESLEGADRVKKIVQGLKDFAHVDEAGHEWANINSGIESAIRVIWNELKYKVSLKTEYGDIPMVKCNPGQLNQVFMNILLNAAYAIEKEGEITVRTWHEAGHVCVSISDTGCGIPENRINRIFEPFYTTKEVGKGTGLGLSIAYDIVKKHSGEIIVESEIGKGTTFTVKIPCSEKGQ